MSGQQNSNSMQRKANNLYVYPNSNDPLIFEQNQQPASGSTFSNVYLGQALAAAENINSV